MPKRPPTICSKAGCGKYATRKGRCDEHQVAWESNKGKTAKERGYGTAWRKLRRRAMERDQHLCQECLRNKVFTLAKEVDHIIPKSRGGTNDMSNLQSLCVKCHRSKTVKEAREARNEAS